MIYMWKFNGDVQLGKARLQIIYKFHYKTILWIFFYITDIVVKYNCFLSDFVKFKYSEYFIEEKKSNFIYYLIHKEIE